MELLNFSQWAKKGNPMTHPTDPMTEQSKALEAFDKIIQNADHDANGVNIGNIRPAYLRHDQIQTIRRALALLEKHEQGYRMMPPEPTEETLEALEELNNSPKYFYKTIFEDNLERLTRAQDDGVFYDE